MSIVLKATIENKTTSVTTPFKKVTARNTLYRQTGQRETESARERARENG